MFSLSGKILSSQTFLSVLRQQSKQTLGYKDSNSLDIFTRFYISNHASYKLSSFTKKHVNVKALDEEEKEIGVVKYSRLQSIALERGMKLQLLDQNAQPHPIYKLVKPKEPEKIKNTPKQPKQKDITKEKVKKVHTKQLRIKSSISPNDLKVKVDHVLDWLVKGLPVNVKITINPDDQRHQKVHDEIVRTVANVGTVSNVRTSHKELMFDLVSSTPVQSESPVDEN